MPKGEGKKKRKKSAPTKRSTILKELRADKKKLGTALRVVLRDLRSFGVGKKTRKA
jgi:hypothetical protein